MVNLNTISSLYRCPHSYPKSTYTQPSRHLIDDISTTISSTQLSQHTLTQLLVGPLMIHRDRAEWVCWLGILKIFGLPRIRINTESL